MSENSSITVDQPTTSVFFFFFFLIYNLYFLVFINLGVLNLNNIYNDLFFFNHHRENGNGQGEQVIQLGNMPPPRKYISNLQN